MASPVVTMRGKQPPAAGLQMDNIELAVDATPKHGRHYLKKKRPSSVNIRSMHGHMEGDETAKLEVLIQSDSKVTAEKIDNLRTSLKGFYDTPCEKWNSKPRKFPIKLMLQLLKVVVVTIQISTFAEERSSFERFSQRNQVSFHHVFLKGWDSGREVPPYPPASGPYAVYSRAELYEHINYVLYQYYRFEDVSLTDFRRMPNDTVKMTTYYYAQAELYPIDKNFNVTPTVSQVFQNEPLPESLGENCTDTSDESCYDVRKYLEEEGEPLDFARLVKISLNITIKGINVKEPRPSLSQPIADVECVEFELTIEYDNSGGNGEILIDLKTLLDMQKCYKGQPNDEQVLEQSVRTGNEAATVGLAIFDGVVLLFCTVSFTLSARSTLHRIQKCRRAKRIFKQHYNYDLTIPEMSDFLSVWYIQIMISDALVFAGTGLKVYLRFGSVATDKTFNNDSVYNSAAILLGVASLAQWIGLLRYLGYFHRYYVLILTISHAVPALIRFLICGVTIYVGFAIAGWVTLGPYNPKFRTFGLTAGTLFSLMNGDELYATMSIIDADGQPVIAAFSAIYLYSYVILFIFAIANLFIAVINDSYESIKSGECFKKSFMQHFIDETLVEVGKTKDKNKKVYEELTADEIDEQYGMLSACLCCFDRCVHHDVNVTKPEEELDNDLRTVLEDSM